MSRMQQVSLICESEIRALALFAPKLLAYSGMSLKLVMKGLAYPLVICRLTPSSIEKMKNMAILCCLKSLKASSPNASTTDFDSPRGLTGHAGSVCA